MLFSMNIRLAIRKNASMALLLAYESMRWKDRKKSKNKKKNLIIQQFFIFNEFWFLSLYIIEEYDVIKSDIDVISFILL